MTDKEKEVLASLFNDVANAAEINKQNPQPSRAIMTTALFLMKQKIVGLLPDPIADEAKGG